MSLIARMRARRRRRHVRPVIRPLTYRAEEMPTPDEGEAWLAAWAAVQGVEDRAWSDALYAAR